MRLAVSEAVSNAIVHGYSQTPEAGDFTVAVEWDLDLLWVTVRDKGCGMRPRVDSPGAGLGLPLIANVTDSFSVTELPEGGTEVCMTFPLRELTPA